MLQSVLSTPYFYFSYTLDLSHTRQRLDKLRSTSDFSQVGSTYVINFSFELKVNLEVIVSCLVPGTCTLKNTWRRIRDPLLSVFWILKYLSRSSILGSFIDADPTSYGSGSYPGHFFGNDIFDTSVSNHVAVSAEERGRVPYLVPTYLPYRLPWNRHSCLQKSLLDRADQRFIWNRHLLQSILSHPKVLFFDTVIVYLFDFVTVGVQKFHWRLTALTA